MKHLSLNNSADKSHLYQLENSVNPIIAAASPMISLLTRIYGINVKTAEPDTWQAICKHEMKICLKQCEQLGYNQANIKQIKTLIVSWINCTSIWKYQEEYTAYTYETFDELMSEKSNNFHIIELLYILNRLGLPLSNNQQDNELKIQELYYLIQDQRQTTTRALQKKIKNDLWITAAKTHKRKNIQWHWFLSVSTTCAIIGIWQFWLSAMQYLKLIFFNTQVF